MVEMLNAKNIVRYTLAEETEIYKKAIECMNMEVFVYNVTSKKIHFFAGRTNPFSILNGGEYFVQDILELNIISPESIQDFRKLFAELSHGEDSVSFNIKTCFNSKNVWSNIMLCKHYDEQGICMRMIGTIQDVTHKVEIEEKYFNERQFRLAMLASSHRVYEVNVTKDRFIKVESIQDSTDFGNWDLYTEAMEYLCRNKVYKEDWDIFLKVAMKENLLKGFEEGITEFYCEYRLINESGEITWASSTTHLLQDPISGDIKGFIYAKNIDAQKRKELELYQQAERDPLTNIYNRRTGEKMITQLLMKSKEKNIHGFLSIDIDDFKLVNDTFGHLEGDALLQELTKAIGEILRSEDIFARMGGDEFVVFLNDFSSVANILIVAERLCEAVRNIQIKTEKDCSTTISIGVTTYPKDGSTFAELYEKSDQALYKVKKNGKNHASVYSK